MTHMESSIPQPPLEATSGRSEDLTWESQRKTGDSAESRYPISHPVVLLISYLLPSLTHLRKCHFSHSLTCLIPSPTLSHLIWLGRSTKTSLSRASTSTTRSKSIHTSPVTWLHGLSNHLSAWHKASSQQASRPLSSQ